MNEQRLVKRLRKRGLSYRQIEKLVHVSKDSIRRWSVEVKLTKGQKKKLMLARKEGQKKASRKGSEENHRRSMEKKVSLIGSGSESIGKLTKNEKFLVGVTLYMAEGTKVGSGVEFTNSDSKAIAFMVKWLEAYCGIPKDKLKFSLWLHIGLDESGAIRYWSDLLNVKKSQFGKTYFAEVRGTRKSNYHEFGIIKIRYYNVDLLNKIKGWIEGIFRDS